MADLLQGSDSYARKLRRELARKYVDVEGISLGQGWYQIQVEANGLMVLLTFTIYKAYSEEFENDQFYVDTNWSIMEENKTLLNTQEDLRLGSDPSGLGLLAMKLKDKLEIAKSPLIVAEKEALLVNEHGEHYEADKKTLHESMKEAQSWINSHSWEAVEVRNRRSNVRPLNEWEKKIHNS